jgi:flavin-dependent dehydrogenase
MTNIKIMGAGLSGLSAAINLSKQGHKVDVFEKRNDCGKRFLGDLEGLENWSSNTDIIEDIKSMNIKTNFNHSPFKNIVITDGKEILRNSSKKPFFYLVKRGAIDHSIDQGFKQQALDSGVNIHFNSKISKNDVDIISTGVEANKPFAIAVGIRFETEMEDIAVALLNKKASNKGYSYLLVDKGYGCMCSVNVYTKQVNANEYFKKTYDIFTKLFDIKIKNEKRVGGVGCFLIYPRYYENGIIRTGEAAGFQDLLWGFGMRYAITSGYLAAKSINEKVNYKKLIKKSFSKWLKTSISNRFLVDMFGDKYYTNLMDWAKSDERWHHLLNYGYNPSLYSRGFYLIAKLGLTMNYFRIIK